VNRNLAHDALTPIRPQHGFDHDVISRANLGYIGASRLQSRPAPFLNQIKVQIDAGHIGDIVWIVVNSPEPIA
jgi:hypothetical protein